MKLKVEIEVDIEPIKGMFCVYMCERDMCDEDESKNDSFKLEIATPHEANLDDWLDSGHTYDKEAFVIDNKGNFFKIV